MLVIKSPQVALTLFTYVLLALTLVEASSHTPGGVSRREHTNLKRFIKKRTPFPLDSTPDHTKDRNAAAGSDDIFNDPLIGIENDPLSQSASSGSASAASSSGSASASEQSSLSASSSGSGSSSSSSTRSSSSSAPSKTEEAPAPTPTAESTHSTSTVTLVSTAKLPTNTGTPLQTGASTSTKSTVTTIIIAVAASIGGIVIIWTIFRKWKLGRSKEFDQRLQPIDWQPSHDDDGIIPAHRRHSGASSFRRYGASDVNSSENGHAPLQPLPDHDFTAGPSLAPVGGYADLARGPSPQPQMKERSQPSGYDAGLPLHHQGYAGQDAYGGVRY